MLIDFNIREDILKHFPNYEYFSCLEPDLLDFNKINNLVGQQQECFIIYWIFKQLREYQGVGLDIGCGQNIHFACLGVNDYYGKKHPTYGGEYLPHITSLAENVEKMFNHNTFSFIVVSHILEHVDDPIITFRNWCKLLKKDGVILLIMPDAKYEIFGWDSTHKTYWEPEKFKNNCILSNEDIIRCEEFNTFKNKFSFNFVGRKI